MNRDALIACLQRTAVSLGRRSVTFQEFRHAAGKSARGYERHFSSFTAFSRAAGLEDPPSCRPASDETLLRLMHETFAAAGHVLPIRRFARACRRNVRTYSRRWGNWAGALEALRAWAERHEPAACYLPELRALGDVLGRRRVPTEDRRYGAFLSFRAMMHEPISEIGVVFLFGQVAEELGFVVESLRAQFPDAEVKRRSGGEWRRLRVEFELRSRAFREHRHDAGMCDLIICWEHNWPECPIEVLELRQQVRELRARQATLPPAEGGSDHLRP